jgi:hypothetical protein
LKARLVLLTLLAALCTVAQGQSLSSEKPEQSIGKLEAVAYLYPEQVTLPIGKSSPVALHFRIEPGFHINSHAPKDEYLIPTVLSIPDGSGVRLDNATYPPGAEFVLPADPDTKLSVYTGEFTIQAKLVAEPGDHLVKAKLRYQACDKTACMPPKSVTVPIDVVGK